MVFGKLVKVLIIKPAMLQLDFNPSGNPNEPVFACLVGKGITFDSGGLQH